MMPEVDGYQLVEYVRSKYSAVELPIIMVTAKDKEQDIVKALDLGANDYIVKPFNFSVLIARIKTQLTLKKYNDDLINANESLKKINEKMEKILNQTIELVKFSRKINLLDFDKMMEISKEMLPKLFQAELFSIFLYDEKEKVLKLIVHNHPDIQSTTEEIKIAENDSIMWDAVRTKKMIRLANFSQSKYVKNPERAKYKNDGVICVPAMVGEKVIGVINLNNVSEDGLENDNIANIQRVSDHLALAINNLLLHKRIEELSIIDELTKFYNRRYLMLKLKEEIERNYRYKSPVSLIMLDIDHFKKINDTYGHDVGDVILKSVSNLIRENLRKTDIPCRYGGEEFIVILPLTILKYAYNIGERIRIELENKEITNSNGLKIKATISIGIAELKENENIDNLLKRVDDALYSAKNKGRNRTEISE